MPIPSPFHERTQPLVTSYRWKDWAGYVAPCRYAKSHEPEYYALRNSVGLLDVSPLFKYEIAGADAAAMLSRMVTRDIRRLAVGRVTYCCWCDPDGKVIDDGTVTRLDEDRFRLTAAEPSLHWLLATSRGFDVTVQDRTAELAAMALQGPAARDVLTACSDMSADLRFFAAAAVDLSGVAAHVTRTGYTGDLGYEVWVAADQAVRAWDILTAAGQPYGLRPVGLDALDMTRIEAGFVMAGVDYFSAHQVVVDWRKSTPYELGLGFTVQLDREPFLGQEALRRAQRDGAAWQLVGLEVDWGELERLYDSYGLPTGLHAEACRDALPVYGPGGQVGQATSHTWSPLLKKQISLASVRTAHAEVGRRLQIEHTVEFERRAVRATVVPTPFFDPERKRS